MREIRGDLDSRTAPSWQSHMSEIRTDNRYPDDDELGPMTQCGYIADSLSDEVSSVVAPKSCILSIESRMYESTRS
jgi:hypothetical protein